MTGIRDYSTTAASNLSIGGISIAEGWARASVNNAYRAGMTDIANLLLDQGGATTTTGSANAYLLNLPTAPTAYADNLFFVCKLHAAVTGASTININGLGVKALKKLVNGEAKPLEAGDGPVGHRPMCIYSSSDNCVLILRAAGDTNVGLFSELSTQSIPDGVDRITTSGHTTFGVGVGTYVDTSVADASPVVPAAHPLWAVETANGRVFRLEVDNGTCRLDQFGADPITRRSSSSGAKTTAAAANLAAWKAAREFCLYYAVNTSGATEGATRPNWYYAGVPEIQFGYGNYWFGGNTLLLTEGQFRITGKGKGQTNAGGAATRLQWDGTCDGMVLHEYSTYSGPEVVAESMGTSGTIVSDMLFDGGGGPLTNDYAGLWILSGASMAVRCVFMDWAGCGTVVGCKPGDFITTNANQCFVIHCDYVYCGFAGISFEGQDSNAGGTEKCSFIYCGYYGIYDSSYLANGHKWHHARGIAYGGMAGTLSHKIIVRNIVSHNDYYWHVVPGAAAAASTTEPGDDVTVWAPFLAAGATPDLTYGPAWVSGTTYAEAGAFRADNINAPSTFIDCYHESDSPGIHMGGPGIALGGLNGFQGRSEGGANLSVYNGSLINRTGGIGFIQYRYDPAVNNGTTASQITLAALGGEYANKTIFSLNDTLYFPSTLRVQFSGDGKDIFFFEYANAPGTVAFVYNGPNTAESYGRAGANAGAYYMNIPNLVIGYSSGGRRLTADYQAPSSGEWAKGDVVMNTNPAPGGRAGWICTTAGTAGSTAVFKPFGVIDA